jgi:hypothetical protein
MARATAETVADLRHHRRELRRELARVRWWRRLVASRRDLSIAQMAGATEPDANVAAAWEALAADAPTSQELAAVIWPGGEQATADLIQRLDEIDSRLGSYERRLSANLEGVTADMIDAMGAAR